VIEACLDIGHHVISREGLRRPGDYREVFAIPREAGILEAGLGVTVSLARAPRGRRRLALGKFDSSSSIRGGQGVSSRHHWTRPNERHQR
jgi:hypothetical protein